jgi:hypothetical protein
MAIVHPIPSSITSTHSICYGNRTSHPVLDYFDPFDMLWQSYIPSRPRSLRLIQHFFHKLPHSRRLVHRQQVIPPRPHPSSTCPPIASPIPQTQRKENQLTSSLASAVFLLPPPGPKESALELPLRPRLPSPSCSLAPIWSWLPNFVAAAGVWCADAPARE